jgi:hypothetical protein
MIYVSNSNYFIFIYLCDSTIRILWPICWCPLYSTNYNRSHAPLSSISTLSLELLRVPVPRCKVLPNKHCDMNFSYIYIYIYMKLDIIKIKFLTVYIWICTTLKNKNKNSITEPNFFKVESIDVWLYCLILRHLWKILHDLIWVLFR